MGQVVPLAAYSGTGDPPAEMSPMTPTAAAASPPPNEARAAAGSGSQAPSTAMIAGIVGGVGAAAVFTGGFVQLCLFSSVLFTGGLCQLCQQCRVAAGAAAALPPFLPLAPHLPAFPPPAPAAAVALLVFLRSRKSKQAAEHGPYVYDKNAAKASPPPRRGGSASNSIDLEGQSTPRHCQPITPRRTALKNGGPQGSFHMHATQPLPASLPSAGVHLVSGVHLLPRAPSSAALGSGRGSRLQPPSGRSMASASDPQVGSWGKGGGIGSAGGGKPRGVAAGAPAHGWQRCCSINQSAASDQRCDLLPPLQLPIAPDAQRAAHRSQQAAEQQAVREYLKSKPPQVGGRVLRRAFVRFVRGVSEDA